MSFTPPTTALPQLKILPDQTAKTFDQEARQVINEASNQPPTAKRKGAPPRFSMYFKDKETKANIPLGAIFANQMPDGSELLSAVLNRNYERDPSKPKYETDKDSFMSTMERYYDGELFLNVAYSANATGGDRATARRMVAKEKPGLGGVEGVKEGVGRRLLRALFNF